jgi:hypothetical protein
MVPKDNLVTILRNHAFLRMFPVKTKLSPLS